MKMFFLFLAGIIVVPASSFAMYENSEDLTQLSLSLDIAQAALGDTDDADRLASSLNEVGLLGRHDWDASSAHSLAQNIMLASTCNVRITISSYEQNKITSFEGKLSRVAQAQLIRLCEGAKLGIVIEPLPK